MNTWWQRALHLAVLWAFAFAQPLFDVLSDNPEFFVARGNGRADILIFSFALVLIPPALMLGAERLAGLVDRRAEIGLHLSFVALLVAAITLPLLEDVISRPASVPIVLALVTGALVALAYARTTFLPTAFTYLSPAPALFLFIFLVVSPVSDVVLPGGGEAKAAPADVPGKAPVVMLVFDEFAATSLMDKSGRIDSARYPNFAELTASSTWYRNATAVSGSTTKAVPAILTGKRPSRSVLPSARFQPNNLFTVLGADYRLRVNETATHLCPQDLCGTEQATAVPALGERLHELGSDLSLVTEHILLPDGIRAHLPTVDAAFSEFRAKPSTKKVRGELFAKSSYNHNPLFNRFVGSIGPQDRSFYFLHFGVPHRPWGDLPSGQRYPAFGTDLSYVDGETLATLWDSNPWTVNQALQRHILEVGYADRLIGELIAQMKEEGIWEKAVVVVTADHGISFLRDLSIRGAEGDNLPEIANVPLFIKASGQDRGRVDSRHVQTIDVLPTIAELLDIDLAFETDGRSALQGGSGEEEVVVRGSKRDIRMDYSRFLSLRDQIVARNARLFGVGAFDRVFGFGPHPELVGQSASALTSSGRGRSAVEIDRGRLYGSVDPGADVVPALVSGAIDEGEAGAELAIAINGQIAAVTRSYELNGETEFSAVVPPAAFRQGVNRVEVFEVVRGGRLVSLGGVNLG